MRGTQLVPAVYVILRRGGKILFTLREHTGFMDGTYSLPSGHVEDKEVYSQAAIRETLEEVGIKLTSEDLRHVHTTHRRAKDHERVDVFFEADNWKGEPFNAEPEKHGDLAWFSEEEMASQPIMDYQADVVKRIARGETYSEWGW